MKHYIRFRLLLVVVGMALGLSSLRALPAGTEELQKATLATLQDLRGVDELKTLFNRDTGKVRLVLLLSPT